MRRHRKKLNPAAEGVHVVRWAGRRAAKSPSRRRAVGTVTREQYYARQGLTPPT